MPISILSPLSTLDIPEWARNEYCELRHGQRVRRVQPNFPNNVDISIDRKATDRRGDQWLVQRRILKVLLRHAN